MSISKQLQQQFQGMMGACLTTAKHVPADKAEWKPEGKGRCAKAVLEHLGASNFALTKVLKNEPLSVKVTRATRGSAAMPTPSYAEAVKQFQASGEAMAHTMGSVADAALNDGRTMPWGEPGTVGFVMALAGIHVSYHMGQLNYLQTLWGDLEDRL